MSPHILMSGKEFINKVLGGERDFTGIELPEGLSLYSHEGYADMNGEILKRAKEDPDERTLYLDHAKLRNITAYCLRAPQMSAYMADFSYSKLPWAELMGANLQHALLWSTDLEGSALRYADPGYGNMSHAGLVWSDLLGSNLTRTILDHADLRNVNNLEYATGLEYSILYKTLVKEKQRDIIKAARSKAVEPYLLLR